MGLSHRNAARPTQNIAEDKSSETVTYADKQSPSSAPVGGPRPRLQKKSSFKEWLQRKRSFTDLFDSEGYTGLSKQWSSLKGKAEEKFGFRKVEGGEPGQGNASPLKGRAALRNVVVKQDTSLWTHFYDSYIYLLRLPAHLFTFYCMLAPFLVAMPFTLVYLLDLEGFIFQEKQQTVSLLELSEGRVPRLGQQGVLLEVYLYSLSLSTTFGASRIDARSPFCLLVANINTLVAQLMFVFLSGAVFQRLSQPSQPVRIATLAILTDDFFEGEGERDSSADKKYKILMTRLVLTGPGSNLIDAKLDLVYRHMMQLPGGSPFMSTHSLKLVRSESSSLRYGMLIRHVINEESPLFGACSQEQLLAEDANFQLTVMATERSSMQPVFADQMFFVTDAEVIWDAHFVDIISLSKGKRVMEHSKLNAYRKEGKVLYHVGGE
ncbi:hypothetical protein KFL_003650080 [Klebsormidium nitens]|uniref:Inward rectifier potassium channel C-terminal domain-containing protein n=1 Tax=Klebsormidium nitens TaxID=105231 RepID=A0A1Y1IFV2_KLENI|nr:hypothetical protein KFL_003650080 [Klebsormidium nitens]|eukprot:GAQ87617.1 hypothetical protein KFL_003650080 [Klebsormidium nitens]